MSMLSPAHNAFLSSYNVPPPCKFPIRHSHLVSPKVLTVFGSLSTRIKGLSKRKVESSPGKRPAVPIGAGSGFLAALSLWSSSEKFEGGGREGIHL